jgi:hypothetical protein
MNKKTIVLFIIFLLLCTFLLGCTEETNTNNNTDKEYDSDKDKFVGTWNTSEPIKWYIKPSFTFFENGTFDVEGYGGTYSVDDGSLELHWDDEDQTVHKYTYMFLDNNTVTITYANGDNGIYKRQ